MWVLTGTKSTEFKPVVVDGRLQCVDIFIEGEWHGSRSTMKAASEYAEYIRKKKE